ncbi:MAG TPA: hypothetical protein VHL58_11695 [Thermoanaerobaculia bacterium]|nr:hypothetical protein [Thermoanaerobaculia bacterium]
MRKYTACVVLMFFASVSAFAHGGTGKKVMGTISKVEATRIHLKLKDGHDSDITLTAKTRFEIGEKTATMKDAVVGRRAVVSLAKDGTAEEVSLGKMSMMKK